MIVLPLESESLRGGLSAESLERGG
jgi:hypothetical protein